MSSLYIHIPFCHAKCPYCNFTSVASGKYIEPYIACLIKELQIRKNFFSGHNILQTIYFGGGTPSVLSVRHLGNIIEAIVSNFALGQDVEMTIEVNPEDIEKTYVRDLLSLGFNRISLGIQSLDINDLRFLGRRHSPEQALTALLTSQDHGFQNISVDIIIGLPTQSKSSIESMLKTFVDHNIPHVSAYLLTIEEPSFFDRWIKQGKMQSPENDEWQAEAFYLCRNIMLNAGYEHYEISNYALPGFRSQHNSTYWQWKPYLGLGVSAHSFNLHTRQWNTSSISEYIQSIHNRTYAPEIEYLSTDAAYNDYVLTHIRTIWGVKASTIEQLFGIRHKHHFEQQARMLCDAQLLEVKESARWTLTERGLIKADAVARELMI